MKFPPFVSRLLFALLLSLACHAQSPPAPVDLIATVMDKAVSRVYATMDQTTRAALTQEKALDLFDAKERKILATAYWHFDVDVPVVVSVMHHGGQATPPFWLSESGFKKTTMQVKNEYYTYDVWQKPFDAGTVGLGINGFDRHRSVYFVSVAPQNPDASVKISALYPNEAVGTMERGAMLYRDWDSLVITELPDELVGQTLLTTYRGRAREAHLSGAFRETRHPSSPTPDQIALSWTGDSATTQDIQWRTDTSQQSGLARYRIQGSETWQHVEAPHEVIHDRLLANDRYIHHFTAHLESLVPATMYEYQVGTGQDTAWSTTYTFQTGPTGTQPFSFGVGSDTHATEDAGKTIQAAFAQQADMAFFIVPGDVVDNGLYRNEWDDFFAYGAGVFERYPLMYSLGNHDDQDGLGAAIPLALFAYPENGPKTEVPESNYSFTYGNALFLMLGVDTQPAVQAAWMDRVLSESDATWKFVVHHFTMYNPCLYHEYGVLRDALLPVIERHQVDMVLQGHVHDYMRTHPMKQGQMVDNFENGTVFVNACAQASDEPVFPAPDYVAMYFRNKAVYLNIRIDGNRLTYEARGQDGTLFEALDINK